MPPTQLQPWPGAQPRPKYWGGTHIKEIFANCTYIQIYITVYCVGIYYIPNFLSTYIQACIRSWFCLIRPAIEGRIYPIAERSEAEALEFWRWIRLEIEARINHMAKWSEAESVAFLLWIWPESQARMNHMTELSEEDSREFLLWI